MTSLESRTLLAAFVVNSAADNTTAGDGLTTLREAIALANANAGADTITFGNGAVVGGTNFTDGTADTITLALGQLLISDDLTITGRGASSTIIDAQQNSRIFDITRTAGDVKLEKLSLKNGQTTGSNGDYYNSNSADTVFSGGAVRSLSTAKLTISQATLSGNSTTGDRAPGGAIFAYNASISIIQSAVFGNSCSGFGSHGGAIATPRGDVLISQSTLTNNVTTGESSVGGALFTNSGSLNVVQSTLSENSTTGKYSAGGAMFVDTGSLNVVQSTLSKNSTTGEWSSGGAISCTDGYALINQSTLSGNFVTGLSSRGGAIDSGYSDTNLMLTQSTVTGNYTDHGPGGAIAHSGRSVKIWNTIIAGNFDDGNGPDLYLPSYWSNSDIHHSLIGKNVGSGLTATDASNPDSNGNLIGSGSPLYPLLGPLQNNGGATLTHALLPGSPAINRGDSSLAPLDSLDLDSDLDTAEVVPFDQRGIGFHRVKGDSVDIGATEASTPSVLSLANRVTSLNENTSTTSRTRVADIVITGGLGTNQLTLSSADAAAFEIVGSQLFLKSGVALNFEAKASYLVTVNVPTSPDSSQDFVLSVTNAAEAPVVTGPLTFSFEEFSPRWTLIGKLNATDSDGDSLSYSIVSGNPDNTLSISDGSVPADGGRLWVYQQDLTGLRHRGMFNLKVRVTDNSEQALFTEVDVKVFILPSQNGSTKLTPSVDGAVSDAGGNGFDSGDAVNLAGTGMLVQGGATPSRGVMEFDLKSLPINRALKSAWLFFSVSALAGGATVNVPIDIFGYAGDGSLNAADASQGTKIGVRPISNADGSNQLKTHSAQLDTSYLRTLIGNSQLGLVLRNDTTSDGVVINTSESSVSSDQKPYLVLQFGDLQPDLFIRDNGQTGTGNQFLTLRSNGSTFAVNTANVFAAGSWERFVTGDFNGDGRTDIAGRLSTDGTWWISLANASGIHQAATQWGTWSATDTWSDVLAADFDGDGKADLAGRVANGDWWVSRSTGTALSAKLWGNWSKANTWSNVTVGDFNRDGRMDIAGRNNLGEWFVSRSTGTTPVNAAFATAKWGQWSTTTNWSDVQIGDFNGDGRTDIAGRSSIGQWWVNRSTGTTFGAAIYYGLWSTNTTWSDVRVADFNGDGRDDILGRSTIGQWWVAETAVNSSFAMKLLGQRTAPQSQWGEMVVGDFNRDGRADIATRNTGDNTVWVSLWTLTGNTPSFVTTNWATLPTAGSPQWRLVRSGRLNG